jgi:hypothetical protein
MSQTDAFQRALLTQLANQGWRRVSVAQANDNRRRGRSAEVWELSSQARPHGLCAYLGLETQIFGAYGGYGYSGRRVHRAHLARTRHELFEQTSPIFEVEQPWPANAVAILTALNRYRQQRIDRPDQPLPAGAVSSEVLEAEWLVASDAEDMLRRLNGYLSERKLRLFACACCRRMPLLMDNERNVRAVEAAERYADGLVPKRELKKARKAADISWLTSYEAWDEALSAIDATVRATLPAGRSHLCALLRDIAGNPFRSVSVKPSWLRYNGGAVQGLAEAIYAEGSFAELPILADALEDAGCVNAELLDHCRNLGEHARGCWAVDAILGRT